MEKSEIRKIRELMGDVCDGQKVKNVKKAIIKIINEGGDQDDNQREKRKRCVN